MQPIQVYSEAVALMARSIAPVAQRFSRNVRRFGGRFTLMVYRQARL
jgi:hypothetical protein